jgi:hypothetical protein
MSSMPASPRGDRLRKRRSHLGKVRFRQPGRSSGRRNTVLDKWGQFDMLVNDAVHADLPHRRIA